MTTGISYLKVGLLIGLLTSGCNNSDFAGGSAEKASSPASKKPAGEALPEDAEPAVRDGLACSQTEVLRINAGVQGHHDRFYGSFSAQDPQRGPVVDILESTLVRIPLESISGDVLPITGFNLDDIAILVKEPVSAASMMSVTSNSRTFTIPAGSIFLYDATNANDFAEGQIDSKGATSYSYEGNKAVIPAGQVKKLKDLYTDLKMPLVPHNGIKISELESKGFVVGGELRFKFVHVAHGYGKLDLQIDVPKCP